MGADFNPAYNTEEKYKLLNIGLKVIDPYSFWFCLCCFIWGPHWTVLRTYSQPCTRGHFFLVGSVTHFECQGPSPGRWCLRQRPSCCPISLAPGVHSSASRVQKSEWTLVPEASSSGALPLSFPAGSRCGPERVSARD